MKGQQGFTLIELMIVIAIIGILASVAVPQYQDYVIRTEASQAISDVRTVQLGVNEYFARYNTLANVGTSTITSYTGFGATGNASGNLSNIAIANGTGVLTLTFDTTANGVNAALAGLNLTLTPTVASNAITWDVTGGTVPAQYRPKMK